MGVGAIGQRGRPAVFLDRDGTLVRTDVRDGVPVPVQTVAQLEILPGVRDGIRRLKEAGFALIVVTNQPDVARGSLDLATVEAMHTWLRAQLPIDEVACCYHDDADACHCRKPKPGMLVDAARRLDIPLASSFMVGDRWRDIEAGKRAGCRSVLVRTPYSGKAVRADAEVADLFQASNIILASREDCA